MKLYGYDPTTFKGAGIVIAVFDRNATGKLVQFNGMMVLWTYFEDPNDVVHVDYNVTFNNKTTNPITIDRLQKQVVEKKLDRFKKIVIIAGES